MTGVASWAQGRGPLWSFDNIRDLLEARGGVRHGGQHQFVALCPAHDDHTASLSVTWRQGDRGGLVLLHCHGGCGTQDIVEALGLSMADLFDEPLPPTDRIGDRAGRSRQQRTAGKRRGNLGRLPTLLVRADPGPAVKHTWERVQTYSYVDAEGRPVQRVFREECTNCPERHKQFKQEFIAATGRKVSTKPDGFTPVLYRMPQVLAAVAAGPPVWVVEGEKDVHTAEGLGLVATTNAQGSQSFPTELAQVFRGATVRVVLDLDTAGFERGVALTEALEAVCARVQLLLPATTDRKSDFTDHVEADLWDPGTEFGGLVPVGVQAVAAHKVLGAVRKRHALVEQALTETQAQAHAVEAAIDRETRGERQRAVQRWAVEAERRFEPMPGLIDDVRRHVVQAGTDWAAGAVEAADTALRQARIAARTALEVAGVAVPPLLQEPAEDPTCDADSSRPPPEAARELTSGGSAPRDGDGPDAEERGWGRERGERTHAGVPIEQPVYRIDGGLVVQRTIKDGQEKLERILGIDARIVEMEYLEAADDTLDVDVPVLRGRENIEGQAEANPPAPAELSAVVIGYTDPATGEVMRLRIPALEYHDCGWVNSLPGPPRYDSKPSGIAKLRDAVRAVGGDQIRRTTRYRSTGWRRGEDGQWFFVHAGGAISSNGARVAPVLLGGPLARYDLPAPCADLARLRAAFVEHSGAMLHRLPARVAAPLLGQVFRSALGPNPWVLALIGSPGSYKTSIASVAMHHWGELWDRRKPATSMSGNGDTLNAVRIKLHSAKDALYWADDVAPTKDWAAAQKALEEFARLVHNGEQRSRSTRDGLGVLDGTPPRASAMITSEVMPRPGSGAQRMLVVPLQAEEINLDELIALNTDESRHGRALLMSSFLQWLAGNLEETRATAFTDAAHYAETLRARGVNTRQADAVAATWTGWTTMCRFLLETGAITDDECQQVLDQVEAGLVDTVAAAADPDLPSSTGARVRELICHALHSHLAYVDDIRTGEAPPWPLAGRLGWRRTPMGVDHGGNERYRVEPKGIRFGYVLHDPTRNERVAQLVVDPSGLEQVLKATAAVMADAPQLDRGTAMRALHDEGVLIAEANGQNRAPRLTVKRTLHCEGRADVRMVALRLDKLFGDEDVHGDGETPPPPAPDDEGGPRGGAETPPSERPGLFTLPAVDDSQHSGLGSESSTPDLTSPALPTEEIAVGSYTDAEGTTAPVEHVTPARPCVVCEVPAGVRFLGTYIHIPCWGASTAATRKPPAASAPTVDPASQAPTPQPQPAPAAKAPTPTAKSAPERSQSSPAASVFTAPAAVLHTDGLWMPDGTRHDLPSPLSHVGHIAALVEQLQLGTQVTPYRVEPGQIWVTAAMLTHLGIDAAALGEDPSALGAQMRELTAGTPLVTGALEQGWQLGGKGGDRLGAWTRVWRADSDKRGVWVALIAAMNHDPLDMPVLGDDPTPAVLARRLNLFAAAVQAPWAMGGSTTGIDLMISLRAKDKHKLFTPCEPVAPARVATLEQDINWSRRPTEAESAHRFVHAYDRGGSYAAGIAGLELGIGAPTHHPEGTSFDAKLPGYWRIEVPDAGDWRLPHPLNPRGRAPAQPVWVTTPTLALAVELGYEQPVLEAYTWAEHSRILDPWYDRIRKARTMLDVDDPNSQAARNQLKVVYTRTIGMLGSEEYMRTRPGYAPDRRHHIVAKARANILRRVRQIGQDSDRWPVAVTADTIIYTSPDPDPTAAWPGAVKHLGRGFGQYKPEASGLLTEQLPHLGEAVYRGKELLDHNWDPSTQDGP